MAFVLLIQQGLGTGGRKVLATERPLTQAPFIGGGGVLAEEEELGVGVHPEIDRCCQKYPQSIMRRDNRTFRNA